jgi:hypothetical protein
MLIFTPIFWVWVHFVAGEKMPGGLIQLLIMCIPIWIAGFVLLEKTFRYLDKNYVQTK